MQSKRLYYLLLICCTAGYIWLALGLTVNQPSSKSVDVCLIKHVLGIPCPSCGSTRAVLSLLKGDVKDSLKFNPIGILLLVIMILSPVWILMDLRMKRETFYQFYLKMEAVIKKPRYAVILILLVIMNWMWNIHKGL